jgi:hypothetical protein
VSFVDRCYVIGESILERDDAGNRGATGVRTEGERGNAFKNDEGENGATVSV